MRHNNGFNKQLSELIKGNGIEIKFSEVNKSRRNDVPKHVKRILEEGNRVKHFLVVHNWISDEARTHWLTPPEKLDPPKKRETEREWAERASSGEFARCVQTLTTSEDFLYCHWIAASREHVYKQLQAANLEGKVLTSLIHKCHHFFSAYRN